MKPYYQFWLEGELLAEDTSLDKLLKFASEQLSKGEWTISNISDFRCIKCEPLNIDVNVNFKERS